MSLGTVCLVGSPNAGKSTIFNRFVGSRKAIVQDTPGVTRDRIYGTCEWLTKTFTVIDTGGIEVKNKPFQASIRAQVQLALDEADLIVFVVDGKKGLSGDDDAVAKMLYMSDKPVIVAVNKVDRIEEMDSVSDFYALGLGEPVAVSGAHGIGIGDLLDKIVSMLPEKDIPDYGDAITFSLIGRPNVGKSSLSNRLLGKERTIVSDIEGTTRDSIDSQFVNDGQNYVLIDTAGLVKRGMIYEAIDKYAAIRALEAIERSEVVLLLIDTETGIREQDAHVVGYAVDKKKYITVNRLQQLFCQRSVNLFCLGNSRFFIYQFILISLLYNIHAEIIVTPGIIHHITADKALRSFLLHFFKTPGLRIHQLP